MSKFTTTPVKFEDEIMSVSAEVAKELGLVKWQVITNEVWWKVFELERKLWIKKMMR
jgi:hypothetical protein